MFSKITSYSLIDTKICSMSSIYDAFLPGLLCGIDADIISHTNSLAIEGLFIFMKSCHIASPQWAELVKDVV